MKKRLRSITFFLGILILLLSFASCSAERDVDDGYSGGDKESSDGLSEGVSTSTDTVIADRKIIKTVNETVETEKYDDFIKNLQASVTASGGYISSSVYTGSASEDNGERYASFVIRIPAEKLSEFTGTVGNLATVVSYEEKQADVTLAYVDISSRIEVLEAEYTALLDILSKASTTADMLAIRAQLEDIQEELASLKAQKQTYDSQIAYSTVNMSVIEVESEISVDNSFFARVGRTFKASLNVLGTFFSALGVFLIGGSPIILLLAAIAAVIILTVRLATKKKNKKSDKDDNVKF